MKIRFESYKFSDSSLTLYFVVNFGFTEEVTSEQNFEK